MRRCDVLVVGGGPAGATCARALGGAGADVVLLDRERFPRDKPCAGWVTPAVFRALGITPDEYVSPGRTLQPFTAFHTSVMGAHARTTTFSEPVSYGIVRSEFDTLLLRRIGTPVHEGTPVTSLRREQRDWIVNEAFAARIVVGAGGHFCPVARALRPPRATPGSDLDLPSHVGRSRSDPRTGDGGSRSDPGRGRVVLAKQMEMRLGRGDRCGINGTTPELYFCEDLEGYGWAIRKGDLLNVGIGRRVGAGFREHVRRFAAFLAREGKVPEAALDSRLWRGHAYMLAEGTMPVGEGLLLIGDSAGLAARESGEGIGPAIESGLVAAEAITAGDGPTDHFQSYAAWVAARSAPGGAAAALRRLAPAALGRALLGNPAFARHVVERFFLHARP